MFETKPVTLTDFITAHAQSLKVLKLSDIKLLDAELQSWAGILQNMASVLRLRNAIFGGDFLAQWSGDPSADPYEYRNTFDRVRVGPGQNHFGYVLRVLLCSPYCSQEKTINDAYAISEQPWQAPGSSEISVRDQLLVHLFTGPRSTNGEMDIGPNFISLYIKKRETCSVLFSEE